MRQRIFIFVLAAVFLFSQVGGVYAKGSSGGRSGGSRSVGGYSGSSSSKSFSSPSGSSSKSSGGSASSSGGYSGSSSSKSSSSSSSSSRSVPGSYSGSSSSSGSSSGKTTPPSGSAASGSSKSTGSASAAKTKTDTLKNSYMQEQYKKELSKNNYSTYKQQLNADQQKAYDTAYNRNYRVNNRMSFEDAMRTRPQRISMFDRRPIIVNVNTGYFGGPFGWGSAFVGPWDMWFLMRASEMFWYHHWNDIYPHRDYFEAQKFAEMEARIKALEQKNIPRDDSYLDPDADPDLQFSKDYQEKNTDKVYYTNKYSKAESNPFATIIVIVLVAGVLIFVIRRISRPKPRKGFDSRIY